MGLPFSTSGISLDREGRAALRPGTGLLGAEDYRYGEDVWRGEGGLSFFSSEVEEHMPLAPKEVLGAYSFSTGYTFDGGRVLHSWV